MDFEEQKEIINPQNGERIQVKKPKWYANWRFWLLSAIAVMLFMISISSVCTACAALNGVAVESEETSQVQRGKHEAFHNDEASYGTENGRMYNYSSNIFVKDGRLNEYTLFSASTLEMGTNVSFSLKAYNSRFNGSYDIWSNGTFWKKVDLTSDSWSANFVFNFSTGYIWIFDHDPYDEGFANGVSQGFVFEELSVFHDNRTFNFLPLTQVEPVSDTTGTMYRVMQWPVFDYRANDVDYHVWMMAEQWLYTSPNYWHVFAYNTNSSSYLPMEQAEAAYFGSWLLPDGVDLDQGSVGTYSWKVLSVDSGVITNILNGAAFRRYFELDAPNPVEIYLEGYNDGYGVGYDGGYNVGRTEGANSVSPDSLTKTLTVVFQQPFNQIYRFFNFNVLGLNILALGCGLISVFIIIKIVKKVI